MTQPINIRCRLNRGTIPFWSGAFELILLVEHRLVPVCSELDAVDPRRRPAHLFADSFKRYIRRAFDDEFIMDMRHDEAMTERAHGVSEDVSRYGLRNVLDELRPVGFDTLPMFRGTGSLVCDRFAAEFVHTDAGFDVAEPTSGRKLDVEHAAFADETDPILRRAVEDGISPDDIFVERDGVRYGYADLVKEVEHVDA